MLARGLTLIVGLAVGFGVALAPGCGTPAARCLPSNCAGCCNGVGQCVTGTADAVCGHGGAQCADCGFGSCTADQVCAAGAAGGAGGGDAGGSAGGLAGGSAGGAGGGAAGGMAGGTAGGAAGGSAGGAAGGAAGGSAGGAGGGAAAQGLLGQYFSSTSVFDVKAISRVDATVDFDWGTGVPIAGVSSDQFSVLWSGRVTPLYSETYTFSTVTDDGTRLWVDGVLLVDNWVDTGPVEHSGTIHLTAGTSYDLRLEYYDHTGPALARLQWASPSQAKQVIPTSALTPWVAPASGNGLWGDYWDNAAGEAYIAHRDDFTLNFSWTGVGPGLPGFSYDTWYDVRWLGYLVAPQTGSYTLTTTSDDGVRVVLDGALIIDDYVAHGVTDDSAVVSLTAGQRLPLRIDYFQETANATLKLWWTPPGGTKVIIPQSALFH